MEYRQKTGNEMINQIKFHCTSAECDR